jgi:FkbM family methyltransferase
MRILRQALRFLIGLAPFKGRYRLADRLGGLLGRDIHETVDIHGVRVEFDHAVLQHRMMYYGLYEENIVNFLRSDLRPGDVVFDPGANIGYFAAVCRGLVGDRGHIYSFEPSNSAWGHILKHNPAADPTRPLPNWTLEHMAITDHSGRMTFYDTPRVMTKGFACLEGTYEPVDRIPHEVEVITIADYCTRKGIGPIAFLKLDIEGSELKALKGAAPQLAAGSIRTIMVETTLRPHTVDTTRAMDELLRSAGYRSFHATRAGRLVPVDVLAHKELRADILWRRAQN